jgi:hypothetical protein
MRPRGSSSAATRLTRKRRRSWRLLSDTQWPDVLSPILLNRFGIGLGSTPVAARDVLSHNFPNVPADVVDERNLEFLGQIAVLNLLREYDGKVARDL